MKRLKLSLVFLLMFAGVACETKQGGDNPPQQSATASVEDTTEPLADSLDELLDEVDPASASAAKLSEATSGQWCYEVAAAQPCINGVKSIAYDSCRLPFRVSVSGTVQLTYSDLACKLDVIGYSVNRQKQLTFTSQLGRLVVDTSDHQDYRGVTIGGGGVATRADHGWDLELRGQRRIVYGPLGAKRKDVSLATLETVKVRGSRQEGVRIVESGILEVNHNILKYTGKFRANNLRYENTCCYPVSGSLDVDYSGLFNRSGRIDFHGCGLATWVTNDAPRELTLNQCEFK